MRTIKLLWVAMAIAMLPIVTIDNEWITMGCIVTLGIVFLLSALYVIEKAERKEKPVEEKELRRMNYDKKVAA